MYFISYLVRSITKKLSTSIWFSLIYIMTFLYYAVSKPVIFIWSSGETNLKHEQNCWKNIWDEDSQIHEKEIFYLLCSLLLSQDELNCGPDRIFWNI